MAMKVRIQHKDEDVVGNTLLSSKKKAHHSREEFSKPASLSEPLSNVYLSKAFGSSIRNRPILKYRDSFVVVPLEKVDDTVAEDGVTTVTREPPPKAPRLQSSLFQAECDDPYLVAWLEAHYPMGGFSVRLSSDTERVPTVMWIGLWREEVSEDGSIENFISFSGSWSERLESTKIRYREKIKLSRKRHLAERAVKYGFGRYRGVTLSKEYSSPSNLMCNKADGISYVLKPLYDLVETVHWRKSMSTYRSVYRDVYFEMFGDKNMSEPYQPFDLTWDLIAEQQKTEVYQSYPEYDYSGMIEKSSFDIEFSSDCFEDANDSPEQADFLAWDKKCEDPGIGISLMPSQFVGGPVVGHRRPLILDKADLDTLQTESTLKILRAESAKRAEDRFVARDNADVGERIGRWRNAARRVHVKRSVNKVDRESTEKYKNVYSGWWKVDKVDNRLCSRAVYGEEWEKIRKENVYPEYIKVLNSERREDLEECFPVCRKTQWHSSFKQYWKKAMILCPDLKGKGRLTINAVVWHCKHYGESWHFNTVHLCSDNPKANTYSEEKFNSILLPEREEVISEVNYELARKLSEHYSRIYAEMFEEHPDFIGPPKPLWLKTGNTVVASTPKIIVPKSEIITDPTRIPVHARWSPVFAPMHGLKFERREVIAESKSSLWKAAYDKARELWKRKVTPSGIEKPKYPPIQWSISKDSNGKEHAIPLVRIV